MTLSPTATLIVAILTVLLLLNIGLAVGVAPLWRRPRAAAPAPFAVLDAADAIQARQVEQHDLIAAGGVIKKQLAQAITARRPQAEIDALIAQEVQNSKDVQRIGVEVSGSFQARNLLTFMNRMDDLGTRILGGQDAIATKIGGLEQQSTLFQAEFRSLLEAVDDFSARLDLVEKSSQRNIAELRDLVTTLALELRELRARTAADAMTATERHAMIQTMRWLHAHTAALAAAMGVPPPEAGAADADA